MGFFSYMKSSISVRLAPLMVVCALMTCCAAASGDYVAAAPNLKVANHLKHDNLTVLALPGCCSACGRDTSEGACATSCAPCGDVVVAAGSVVGLDSHVGPYPLHYMAMEVFGKVWCVELSDLELIKPWVTLAVGPDGCGPHNGGIEASVFVRRDEGPLHVTPLCLYQCFYKA